MDKLIKIRVILVTIVAISTTVCGAKLLIKPESKKWYGVLFVSDYFPPLNGFPNASDANERSLICQKLGEIYNFKTSTLHPDHKAFYGLPGNRHTVITIYQVIDQAEQEKIIQAAKKVKRTYGVREFTIEFYSKETGPSPANQFLRKVRID
jgi:hypothetical protein